MSGLLVGSLGASRIADALAKTKSGWGASRANLMAEIIAERLTGQPYETYINADMQRGLDTEPQARIAYEFLNDVIVEQTEPIRHPTIDGAHASPDGLVGNGGLVEFKCPKTSTHIDTLLAAQIPERYIYQMQWQMACTGREWCDFVSFDPRLPASMQIFTKRVSRSQEDILHLENEVAIFLAAVDGKIAKLRGLYELQKASAA